MTSQEPAPLEGPELDVEIAEGLRFSSRDFVPLALAYLSGPLSSADPRFTFICDLQDIQFVYKDFSYGERSRDYRSKVGLLMPPFKFSFDAPSDHIPPFVIGPHSLTVLKFCHVSKILLEKGTLVDGDWRLALIRKLCPNFSLTEDPQKFYVPGSGKLWATAMSLAALMVPVTSAAVALGWMFYIYQMELDWVSGGHVLLWLLAVGLAFLAHDAYRRASERSADVTARTINPRRAEAFFASFQEDPARYARSIRERTQTAVLIHKCLLVPVHLATLALFFGVAGEVYLSRGPSADLIDRERREILHLQHQFQAWLPQPVQLLMIFLAVAVPLAVFGLSLLARYCPPLEPQGAEHSP